MGCGLWGGESLTERDQVLVVLQHDIFIQILLNGAQPFPLLLGEVDGQIPKRHWHLKQKIPCPFTTGLCFHMAGDNEELVPNMGDPWCQESIQETSEVLRPRGADVLNKINTTQYNMA